MGIFFLIAVLSVPCFASWECEWDMTEKKDSYSEEKLQKSLSEETSAVKIAALLFIRLYHFTLSGKGGVDCVFYPSCSRYGFFSVKKYGLIKGAIMSADRMLRCNPSAHSDHYKMYFEKNLLLNEPAEDSLDNFIFEILNF
ncbi:MAG: membrane protein insertion efficiency factor YidD [Candidatus Goldiibacteriota bacterium]